MFCSRVQHATLKDIQLRLKSIKNIEKITKSMKMIATTKLTRAQRAMEVAKVIGDAQVEVEKNAVLPKSENTVFIGITSDRGLCGGVHSNITKFIKRNVKEPNFIVAVGDKSKAQLSREHRSKIVYSFNQLGKNVPVFQEACLIADALLADEKLKNVSHKVVYNNFKSIVSYETKAVELPTPEKIKDVDLGKYENESDSFQNAAEFLYASKVITSYVVVLYDV
eukprot:NODE_241_length_11910_cov_1.082381.p7 type:complete len:223 gc:universal NODE_241_length_11910_cov_1.082381:9935-9267(-)